MKKGTGCVVALAIFGIMAISFFLVGGMRGWFLIVPAPKDPLLVGTWNGSWPTGSSGEKEEIVFRTDGSGERTEGQRHWRFVWGTRRGILFAKSAASGKWALEKSDYSVNPVKGTATFASGGGSVIPTSMTNK